MDLDAYFARIGYTGPRDATLAVLRDLASLHPQTISFENIAVAAGGVPDITLPAIEAKLVGSGRGGNNATQRVIRNSIAALEESTAPPT